MSQTKTEAALLAALQAENAALKDALRTIAGHLPACSPESETAWSNRVWAGHFRDLQRIAMTTLDRLKETTG